VRSAQKNMWQALLNREITVQPLEAISCMYSCIGCSGCHNRRRTRRKFSKNGNLLYEQLSELAEKYSIIQEVRGKGLMIGVQLSIDAAVEIKNKCFEKAI